MALAFWPNLLYPGRTFAHRDIWDVLGYDDDWIDVPALSQMHSWNAHMSKTKDNYVVQAILPGLDKNSIKLDVSQDRRLAISVQLNTESSANCKMRQSWAQQFYIPNDGDLDAIRAKMNNGVLEVVVPRSKPETPSKRTILIA